MDLQPNDSFIKRELNKRLSALEDYLKADIMSLTGSLQENKNRALLGIIEDLANTDEKKDTLFIILTTTGGSAHAVDMFVNIIRHNYKTVNFIVPQYAYSAGTIFCMSGDEIYMDYSSVLGPIDPQVQNKDGRWVAALGYLDKIKELLEKAKNDTLTSPEFIILKDFDLAELRGYEQARDLTVDLLQKWLVKYKFKNWKIHKTSKSKVMDTEKKKRAQEIARSLGDTSKWKAHGRPINIQSLRDMKLKIEDYGDNPKLKVLIRSYSDFLNDYIQHFQRTLPSQSLNQFIFLHTRTFI